MNTATPRQVKRPQMLALTTIRTTDDEHEALKLAAQRAGFVSTSAWGRMVLLRAANAQQTPEELKARLATDAALASSASARTLDLFTGSPERAFTAAIRRGIAASRTRGSGAGQAPVKRGARAKKAPPKAKRRKGRKK
jgi:hypothetical protein